MRRAFLLAVVVAGASGCYFVTDFEPPPSSSASGSTTTASSASTGGGGAGGGGGGDPCAEVNLATDPQHCGACGWDCGAGATCADGICSPAAAAVAANRSIASIASNEVAVLVTAGDFSGLTVESWLHAGWHDLAGHGSLSDASLGEENAGFAGKANLDLVYFYQSFNGADPPAAATCTWTEETTPVFTCSAPFEFQNGLSTHVNSAVTRQGTVLVLGSGANDDIFGYDAGAPEVPTDHIPFTLPPGAPLAVSGRLALGPGGELFWTSAEGCVYRESAGADCYYPSDGTGLPGLLSIFASGVGVFYEVGGALSRLELGATPTGTPTTLSIPAAIDARFLYAKSAAGGLAVVDAASLVELHTVARSQGLTAVDASHPDYVFFAVGTQLYRWRKPAPGILE